MLMRTYAHQIHFKTGTDIQKVLPQLKNEYGSVKTVGVSNGNVEIKVKSKDVGETSLVNKKLFSDYPIDSINVQHKPTLTERLLRR